MQILLFLQSEEQPNPSTGGRIEALARRPPYPQGAPAAASQPPSPAHALFSGAVEAPATTPRRVGVPRQPIRTAHVLTGAGPPRAEEDGGGG